MISHLEFGIWVHEGMYLYPQFTDLFLLRHYFSLLKAEGRFLRAWMWLTKILPFFSSSSSSSEHLHFVVWLLLIHNLKFSCNYIAHAESVLSAMTVHSFLSRIVKELGVALGDGRDPLPLVWFLSWFLHTEHFQHFYLLFIFSWVLCSLIMICYGKTSVNWVFFPSNNIFSYLFLPCLHISTVTAFLHPPAYSNCTCMSTQSSFCGR